MTIKNKKIYFVIAIIFVALLFTWNDARAYDANFVLPNLTNLPGPINDFINSAKQIGQNVISPSINVSNVNPKNIFESADTWFKGVTGISLIGILKAMGNLVVWILTELTNLIKRGLSFI